MENFLVNKTKLSQILDVSQQTLTNWQNLKNDPMSVHAKGKNGQANQYSLSAVIQWRIRYEVNKLVTNPNGEVVDYEAERARLTKEQADGQALKNEKIRANLISVSAAIAVFMEISSIATNRLDSARAEIKTKVPGLSDAQYRTINRIYDDARNAIADVSPEAIIDKIVRDITSELESS